jgi:hypothetical protein
MSNYTKSTNFTSKDSLPSGDALKIVKGAEFDTEFNAIATAVATKADIASPTFTGTPLAPTAAAGTSSTQIATTAFLATMYPVGTVYTNISVSTNPGTLFGFGTWVAITGRVIVGLDSGDASFDTVGETGGSKDAIVVSHTHTATDSGHTHNMETVASLYNVGDGAIDGSAHATGADKDYVTRATASGTANITVASTGSSGTNANLQPYVVAYVWKRVS